MNLQDMMRRLAREPVQHTDFLLELASARRYVEDANRRLACALAHAGHLDQGVRDRIVQLGKPLGRVHGEITNIAECAEREVQ